MTDYPVSHTFLVRAETAALAGRHIKRYLDGNQLIVHYQGACGTCPSSISGTLRGIQNLLRSIEPEIEVVLA